MKKLIVLIILFVQITAFAQLENSLLWEISGNGLEKPSYIYGTIHYICKTQDLLKPKLKAIIKSSENVYLEIVYDEHLNNFKAHYDVYLKNGKSLSSYYTPTEYIFLEKQFNKKMKRYGLELGFFKNFKPAEILGFIVPSVIKCTNPTSYEEEISKIAKKNKIKIIGLENYEEHNSFQTESDSLTQVNATRFYEFITNKEKVVENFNEYNNLKTLYLQEKIEELYQSSNANSMKSEIELVLDFRNKLWIPRIAEASKKGQILYAFGAAHLAGENGVINLLRKEGYTVTPVFE